MNLNSLIFALHFTISHVKTRYEYATTYSYATVSDLLVRYIFTLCGLVYNTCVCFTFFIGF